MNCAAVMDPPGLRLIVAFSAASTLLYTPVFKHLTAVKNATVAIVIALAPMAGDVSRWLGFACINLLLLALMDLLPLRPPRWHGLLLAAALLLGPIGVVASFPMIQSKLGPW